MMWWEEHEFVANVQREREKERKRVRVSHWPGQDMNINKLKPIVLLSLIYEQAAAVKYEKANKE